MKHGSRWFASLLPLLIIGALPCFADVARQDRPNIVLIVADDLGYGDLGCYGAPDVRSPNLDRLARDGIRMVSFYANGPECSPTRTALMTGRYQHRVGGLECAIGVHNVGRYDDAIRLAEAHDLGLPVAEVTLPLQLRDAGYRCGLFGKWHLGYEDKFLPMKHGFEKTFGCLGGNCDYFTHTEEDGWNTLIEDDRLIERDGYMTDLITAEALRWYHEVNEDERPFFLYVPFTSPHTPIQGPDDDHGALTTPQDWNRGTRETYVEMVERMDRGIGELLSAIEADGLARNTLVVFMSDNGGTSLSRNDPYSGTKGTTREGGIRVPCIASWPGHLPEGRVVNHTAITMDFAVSLLRIAGVEPGAGRPADGVDILAEIQNDRPPVARTLFWRGRRGDRTWRAIRDGSLKRIWLVEGDQTQSWMYDLEADPAEQHDLLSLRSEDARRLEQRMREWEQDVRAMR